MTERQPRRQPNESVSDYAKRVFPHECINPHRLMSEPHVSDFTTTDSDLSIITHFYCHRCQAHVFRGKHYTKAQWEEYINTPLEA